MPETRFLTAAAAAACLCATPALASPVTTIDLDTIDLSDVIVGPAGPTVETTFAFMDGDDLVGVADLISFVACQPSCDAADVTYTYVHQIIPGVDLPNDSPPLPDPDRVVDLDGVTEFALEFEALGFTGEAGFDFGEAAAALGSPDITIELTAAGRLVWTLPEGFDTGETITFFWRSAFAPSGPGGTYGITNGELSGVGAGPIPGAPVPVPAAGLLLLTGLGGLVAARRRG